jgi:hypothetical protein
VHLSEQCIGYDLSLGFGGWQLLLDLVVVLQPTCPECNNVTVIPIIELIDEFVSWCAGRSSSGINVEMVELCCFGGRLKYGVGCGA